MPALKIGYTPVSTTGQDLTAQRDALARLDVQGDRVHVVDLGLSGTNRTRLGLREAMAACRAQGRPGRHQARPPRPLPTQLPPAAPDESYDGNTAGGEHP